MNTMLDILGSFVLGGLVIMLLVQVDSTTRTYNYQKQFDMLNQERIIGTNDAVQDDFYKIGYRIKGSKIILADSVGIKFYTDYNNDGIVDTVRYYLGSKGALANTVNPQDMPLFKTVNGGKQIFIEAVTNFKLIYFDSSGTALTYASLLNQSSRNTVKCIQVRIDCQSPEPIDDVYQSISWQQNIKPKNLN